MKAIWVPFLMGLVPLSGCLGRASLGVAVEDPALKAELLQRVKRVHVATAVFHTLIQWPGREVSLVEVVKALDEGGLSVAGLTDMGNTVYAARVDADGRTHVLVRNLPLSEAWLVDGLMAGLLIPWHVPDASAQVWRRPDGELALAHSQGRLTRVYILDDQGVWHTVESLCGQRTVSRTHVDWDGQPVPVKMQTEDGQHHFRAIRERVLWD